MKLTAKFENSPATKSQPDPTPAKATGGMDASPAARNLALAYHLDGLIERGLLADYSAAAKVLGVSQPRLTHLMSLLLLGKRPVDPSGRERNRRHDRRHDEDSGR